ncbi:MAG: phytanoyl-CoA dioxygenase family protein [Verrucomicrobia bacterium]|nr:phytanoyl-CoA dioxygenase family protein [Verrucomicrobiota bacterium]
MISEVQKQGFTIVRELLPCVDELISSLGEATGAGRRGMLNQTVVHELANSEAFLRVIQPFLPGSPRPVRGIYFDKSPSANWLVAWHQDLTITVTHQEEVPGFGPWSKKDGLIHVQPPVELLQSMITLRLHLDDTDESNGALRVLPSSHIHGRLAAADIARLRETTPEVTCRASRGDALLMRPLLLHASGRSTSEGHRRILHIEYAGCDLPQGLRWNEAG